MQFPYSHHRWHLHFQRLEVVTFSMARRAVALPLSLKTSRLLGTFCLDAA